MVTLGLPFTAENFMYRETPSLIQRDSSGRPGMANQHFKAPWEDLRSRMDKNTSIKTIPQLPTNVYRTLHRASNLQQLLSLRACWKYKFLPPPPL